MLIVPLIGLAVAAAVVAHGTWLFVPAVVVAVASFWSNGVMHNFRDEPLAAPDWSATVSMITTAASVVILIAAFLVG